METVLPSLKWIRSFVVQASACIAVAILSHAAFGQTTVSTNPAGLINLTVAAGTGSSPTVSVLSFPLFNDAAITGQSSGVITGITANSISNSNAGWTAGALSVAASPCILQITSGAAKGRIFLLSTTTANTSTTVTIDTQESTQVDLTTLGIATGTSGDTYSIYGCDTLRGVFGAGSTTASGTTVLGAGQSAAADVVQLFVNGAWQRYFYNTGTGHWTSVGLPQISDNVAIRPDAGVIYSRLAAFPLNLTVTGNVPTVNRQAIVANSGVSFLSSAWPIDITLASSNIAAIPGWVASSSSASADIVQMFVSGAWQRYYYNGTHWYTVGLPVQSDSVTIPCGSAVILQKKGAATGSTTLAQPLPYSL